MLGIGFVRLPSLGRTQRAYISQSGYVETICLKFVEEAGLKGSEALRPISTPAKAKTEASDEAKRGRPGRFAKFGPVHVGRLVWIVRGSRPDVAVATSRLARRLKDWSELEDEALFRLYRYLWLTRFLAFFFTANLDTLRSMSEEVYADADFAGGRPVVCKSSTSCVAAMGGPGTWAALIWATHIQGATAKSTPEAEVIAESDATFEAAAPLLELWEQVTGVTLPLNSHTDNEACRPCVGTGVSRRLSYLRKHQEVSLSAIHGSYQRRGSNLLRLPSEDNAADIMTKPLDHVAHWIGVRLLGLGIPI